MNILLLGSGGREHALAWKITQSPLVQKLYVAPGNPGIGKIAECLPLAIEKPAEVVAKAKALSIDLVVVGPEGPLVSGVVDACTDAGILCFGPTRAAAMVEGSKAYAKAIMQEAGIPTAHSETFEDVQSALAAARRMGRVAVKADGLCAGKGVVVARTFEEAAPAIASLMATPAGKTLVLEEYLEGPEVSVIALCDGERAVMLPPSRDHKRLKAFDEGPNTGGMGAFCPVADAPANLLSWTHEKVILPALRSLAARGTPFRGALYAGLMLTEHGPKVLEFNARLGDPETQVLMMMIDEDIVPLLVSCAKGHLQKDIVRVSSGTALGVVLASEGYPERPVLGREIRGLNSVGNEAIVFHAGTKQSLEQVVSSGGRILTVVALKSSKEEARKAVHSALHQLSCDGAQWRQDI